MAWVSVRVVSREEGISGLFRGIESKMVQTVANSALIFLIYERLLRYLRESCARACSAGCLGCVP